MLGLGKKEGGWQWIATGKHPSAKDYFTIGKESAFSEAFSRWIEQGYEILPFELKRASRMGSWRFWAKTPNNEILILGLIRDSCDSIGRPYPLLIMGVGSLAGWVKQWDLLPHACEQTWAQMEYIAAKNYSDTKKFGDELTGVSGPKTDWNSFRQDSPVGESLEQIGSSTLSEIKHLMYNYLNSGELMAELKQGLVKDLFSLVCLWHFVLKEKNTSPPNAVFMGGIPGRNFLAIYGRALAPKDFVNLWSLDNS